MTWRTGTSLALQVPGTALDRAQSTCKGCGAAFHDPAALNGIEAREPNGTKGSHGGASRLPTTRARSPWVSIAVAVVAVAIVLGVELWAARRAPAPDGTVTSEVATEVSATLGDVAASSVLIGPSN